MHAEVPAEPAHHWVTRLGVKLYRYRALFRQRWWLLAIAVGAGLLLGSILIVLKPVRFKSEGRMVVSEQIETAENSQFLEQQSNYAETQVMIMQSPDVLDRTRRRLALEGVQLSGSVKVEAMVEPRTFIFTISGIGREAEPTRRYVQALMEEFINYKREKRRDSAASSASQIGVELDKLRAEVRDKEDALHKFAEQNDMAFWDEQGKTSAKFLSDLKTQQANLLNELHRLETLSSEDLLNRPAQSIQPSAKGPDGSVVQTDPGIGSDLSTEYFEKTRQLVQLQAEFKERSRIWKPKHPRLKALRDSIDSLNRLIDTIKEQTRESSTARIASIKAELGSLDASITTWESKVLEASRKDAEYQRLKDTLTRTQGLYEKLLLSMQSSEVVNKVTPETLQILQQATLAKRVSRGIVTHLALGLILGLLAGGGLLVFLDRADDRFASSSEIVEQFTEPVLGQIPGAESSRTADGLLLIQPEDDRYMFAEAFRSLRSSLIFIPGDKPAKLILVTSAIPGEGKSTVASNLAITLALAGSKTLLVDCDLRRGDLAHLFDADGRVGFSTVLRGEVPWRDACQPTKYAHLSLLPRGPVTNQSSELILSGNIENLLAEFREAFDFVIFNTSPILATDDTPSIAPRFDGTLLVMRAQFTSARSTHNALNALYQRRVNLFGLVLNGIDTGMPDYYYYQYPKYYAAQ
jgi:capsular exopolysaccharide synthesis family protein